MLLAFHINLIKSKCYRQHTYGIFFYFFINFSNTLRVSMGGAHIVKKITILFFFFLIIDINDRFNVHRIINYYNVKHIKDNIYEA